jgi:hypothetical protein
MESNVNNGINSRVFGPGLWLASHAITFGYPYKNPTDAQKHDYKEFFRLLGYVLPCCHCRASYQQFIQSGATALTDAVMENRYTLTKWLYDVHNAVNDKLGVVYGVDFKDIQSRYESYRAGCDKSKHGCITVLDNKLQPFRVLSIKDCPLIQYNNALKFVRYARQRNLPDSDYYILAKIKEKNALDKCLNNKFNDETWCRRNKECKEIIDYMRINGSPSIETEGPWKDYPTIPELKLILRLSSNLPNNELLELIKKIHI